MKYIVIFILTFSVLFAQNNLQDNFFDTIMLDQIERLYPNDNIVKPFSYIISMHFDLNRYRLNEPITMEIKIYAKKGSVSFTNSDNPFNNYKFKVYDNYNNEIVNSDNYTLWKYKNEKSAGINQNRVITLREGESYSYFIDLNNWFQFDKIGRYRIEGSFNPMPDISDNFSMIADTSYFLVDYPRQYNEQNPRSIDAITNNNNLPFYHPSQVVSNTLFSMKSKSWSNYFNYMHLPSIISISQRYSETYRNNFSNTYLEDFTDF